MAWATRVQVPAVISSERDTRGVILVGIDPERERRSPSWPTTWPRGASSSRRDDEGLVVGRKLLERLETDLGKRVVVMSQDRENEIADRGFRIVGVFDSQLRPRRRASSSPAGPPSSACSRWATRCSEIAVLGTDYRNVDGLRGSRGEAAAARTSRSRPGTSSTPTWARCCR